MGSDGVWRRAHITDNGVVERGVCDVSRHQRDGDEGVDKTWLWHHGYTRQWSFLGVRLYASEYSHFQSPPIFLLFFILFKVSLFIFVMYFFC